MQIPQSIAHARANWTSSRSSSIKTTEKYDACTNTDRCWTCGGARCSGGVGLPVDGVGATLWWLGHDGRLRPWLWAHGRLWPWHDGWLRPRHDGRLRPMGGRGWGDGPGAGQWNCPAFARGNGPGYGPGYGPQGSAQDNQTLNLTTDDVKTRMERWLALRGQSASQTRRREGEGRRHDHSRRRHHGQFLGRSIHRRPPHRIRSPR